MDDDMDKIIDDAGLRAIHDLLELATLRYEIRHLPVLIRIIDSFRQIEPELIRHQCPDDIYEPFCASRNELRRWIRQIEQRKQQEGRETAQ